MIRMEKIIIEVNTEMTKRVLSEVVTQKAGISTRDIQRRLGLHTSSVRRALRLLEGEGLVYRVKKNCNGRMVCHYFGTYGSHEIKIVLEN